jgi:chromosome segregation ATPase
LIFTLSVSIIPSTNAATLGGKCTKLNAFAKIGQKISICSKSGSKMIWKPATPAQKTVYKEQQVQIMVSNRKKTIQEIQDLKNQYSVLQSNLPILNSSLIDSKKSIVAEVRNQIIDLQKQKETQQQNRATNQSNLASLVNSINTTQSNINSLQNQINAQQSVVNNSKINNDSSYNAYISAKAQSDYLAYSYERALRDNSAMLSAKILCDFGFGSCGIYSSVQYNYNASIISQYNSASARTSGAYASYVGYNSRYSSDLTTLNALKSQQSQLSNTLNSLNTQRNQVSTNISNTDSKIASLEVSINQALAKSAPLENAEKRIEQDIQKYTEMKSGIEVKFVELIAAIEEFIQLANDEYILRVSNSEWNGKYQAISGIKNEIDSSHSEMKTLTTSLESFLNSL